MSSQLLTVHLALVLALAACGAGTQQIEAKAGGEGREATASGEGNRGSPEATRTVDTRMRVGHYRSSDGAMGFRLDRTDPRRGTIQYDGSTEVIDLEPRAGSLGRTDYWRKGYGVVVSVYPDGRVVAYHGDRPDGMTMTRDDVKQEPCCKDRPRVTKDQPVEMKLRLGHFIDSDATIGFVLDRRDEKVGKLRFDGSQEIVELRPQQGPGGRIDYFRKGQGCVLNVYSDGRVVLYHKDRPDGVPVRRDGDADPL